MSDVFLCMVWMGMDGQGMKRLDRCRVGRRSLSGVSPKAVEVCV